jgi:hypothetical protein
MANEKWHTEGYLMLASMFLYLAAQNQFLTAKDREDTFAILRYAGKQIRQETR